MTLHDFKALQAEKRWRRFTLHCENQPRHTGRHQHFQFTFEKMVVLPFSPAAVHLRRTAGDTSQNADHLTLWGVESIDCIPCVLGDMLTFHCKAGRAKRDCIVILAQ